MQNERIFNDPEDLVKILQETVDTFGDEITDRSQMPDPYELHDMKEAVDIFTEVVANSEKIKLIIDSDYDGLGTYTLWYNFFTHFPYQNIELLITDRKKGYGFIPEYVDDETKLYITSDNGITSIDATDAANCKGARVIICDHHQPDPGGLPMAAAIIDPYHPDDTFEPKEISGTFVLWFFLKALMDKYNVGVDAFDEFLQEVALTTISDVMPLTVPLNRFVIKTFVDKFCEEETSHRQYLNTFREQVNNKPTAESFAFGLIPMINATQRMTKADHGAMFLVAPDAKSSLDWFNYIKGLNDARKERQQTLLSYIEKYYKDYIKAPFIVVPGKFQKEYKGVLGIIAGNLAREKNKPCIILNYNADKKEYTGSGRSIGELNILEVLRKNPYIQNVGGHTAALGITIKEDKFEDFWTQLQKDIMQVPEHILKPEKEILGVIPMNKLSWDFFETIKQFEPFGHKFRKPVFKTTGVIKAASLMGKQKNHLRFTLTDTKGLVKFEGVKFFTTDVPEKGETYEVFFTITDDDYKGGENIKIMAEDFKKISKPEDVPPWEEV